MNSKRLYRRVIALILVAGLAGSCVGQEEPGDAPLQPSASESISVTFVNNIDEDICAISASIIGTNDRNDNILEETLKPGDSFMLTELEPMTVNLIALDCSGNVIAENNEFLLESGEYIWEIKGSEVVMAERPEPPPTSPDQVWLVMLYLDADDETLEYYINYSLNEAELVGSTDQVQIVAQLDRFEGGFAGDGDWTTAKRYYVTNDADLNTIGSEELMDLGEVNMADPDTLADFVIRAVETYPADKYVLILSDHGSGYPGGWYDQSAVGDLLTLLDLDSALAQVQNETSLDQFELIVFDACLMSTLEVYTAIAPYARYSVASEEVTWSTTALPYASFLNDLVSDPGMNGEKLAESIVRHNINGDTARLGLPENIIQLYNSSSTLSAVDLAMIPDLLAALDELLIAVSETDQGNVALARYFAQSYQSIFPGIHSPFLDLGHLAKLMALEAQNAEITHASNQLRATLDQVVFAEKHGSERPGSTGISLYFPNSMLFGAFDSISGSYAYSSLAGRFARESLWDDFLLFHYTDASMPKEGEGNIAFADQTTPIIGPGAGQIEIAPITTSSETFSMDHPVSLSTEVTGSNIAHVHLFMGPYDHETNAVLLREKSFLRADVDKEVSGVIYPDWKAQTEDGVLVIGGDLWPQALVVSDGTNTVITSFRDEKYAGRYRYVDGIYTSAATGNQSSASLLFNVDSAEMLKMELNIYNGVTYIPIEYPPQPGDQFTVGLAWLDLATGEPYNTIGDTLTFGDQSFWLDAEALPPGQFYLGTIVEDLDGNAFYQSIMLTVEAE